MQIPKYLAKPYSTDDVEGDPIPGEELGPVESKKMWGQLKTSANLWRDTSEKFAATLAKFFDLNGTSHITQINGHITYIAGIAGVSNSRLYQMIRFGRAQYHLCTTVHSSGSITERAMRPALCLKTDQMSRVIQKADGFAKPEKPSVNGYRIREQHVKDAMSVLGIKSPRSRPKRTQLQDVYSAIDRAYVLACACRSTPVSARDCLQQALEEIGEQ